MSLSAIVITLNEAAQIEECLASLDWVDEIIVVDAESTDATVEIARRHTDRVFVRPWVGYGPTRNWALEQARGDWILVVDADERVPPGLRREIESAISRRDAPDAFYIPRRLIFLGHRLRHGGSYPDYQLRLLRRGRGSYGDHLVHESLQVTGPQGWLHEPLVHYSHRDLPHYLAKAAQYAWAGARERMRQGYSIGWLRLVLGPGGEFLKRYFLRAGFLDSWPGFLYCALSSWQTAVKYLAWRKLQRQVARPAR